MANEVGVGKHCLVICGEWKCSLDGEWNVEIDKQRWSRIVRIRSGRTIYGFEEDVCTEFAMNGSSVSLTYWSPDSMGLMTGKKTPPVVVKTDVGYEYFLELLMSNCQLNLFVAFEKVESNCCGSKGKEGRESPSLLQGSNKRWCGGTAGSKTSAGIGTAGSKTSAAGVEETEFIDELEKVEATMGVDRGPIVSEVDRCSSGEEVDGDLDDWRLSDEEEDGVCDEEVAPGGYDKEFWSPFLEEEYGGSNAVEVMCSTNDAFDHRVVLNGGAKDEEKINGTAWMGIDGHDAQCGLETPWTGGVGNVHGSTCTASGGQGSGSNMMQRKLEDVDDEEFDIPPLFDDTEYQRDDIPDLDIDDDGKGIYKGKVYGSKVDCQIAMAIFAIKNMFCFRQSRTRRDSFVLSCPDRRCDWRVLAREIGDNGYYEIRKAYLDHTCSIETRGKFMKKATSRVIAAVYKAKYNDPTKGPAPLDLQQLVLEDLSVSTSYFKCWRAKGKAIEGVIGTDDESYAQLAEYLYVLKLANPGTVADIESVTEEDGSERFFYMFLAFGASIQGFRQLRRVLVVDGTHLSGKYKGVLLTASGQDGNFQVFPLAFAVVDSENDEAWTWFFQKLERLIADSANLTIISDRHQSIYKAKSRVFPLAHHGACIVHLQRNVTARFKNKGLAKMVVNAGYAYKLSTFKENFKQIKSRNNECAKYLEKIGMAHWTRVYFRGDRYNLMTSNIAETLNKALSKGRASPIVELVKFIRAMLTRWFSARRTKSGTHRGPVTPEVDKVMTKNLAEVKGSKIGNVSSWSYEIIHPLGARHHVMLDGKNCNCKEFDRLKIPCGHAMVAADEKAVAYSTLVADYYKTSTWSATYEGVVNPEIDPREVDFPTDVVNRRLLPPRTRRPSGRPREVRIPSIGEFSKAKTVRVAVNRCGRCRGIGHNRTKCTNPI